MAARRGARSGRGWDALPPRPARASDEYPSGEPSGDAPERGNVPARHRRGAPGGLPGDAAAFDPDGLDPDGLDPDGFDPDGSGSASSGWSPRGSRSGSFGSSGSASSGSGSRGSGSRGSGSGAFGSSGSSSGGSGSGAFGSSGSGSGGSGSRRGRSGGGRGAGSGGSESGGGSGPGRFGGGRGAGSGGSDSGGGRFGGGRGADPGSDESGDGSGSRRGRSGGGSSAESTQPAQPAQSESDRAREICLRQLAVRPRTRAELAKVLARKEISEEVIAEVLDRYDEVGIIDDAAFARAWVASRHHGRGLARRALANELRQRGVDAEVAGEALESLDEDDEAATARALVDRKLRTTRGEPEAVFRRLVGMLARKGYPAGIAIRAVKDALAARDAEAAEFVDGIDPDSLTE